MIQLIINGQEAYPKLSDTIKVTRQNFYIKDTDSYTYDITLPMHIAKNREVVGNLQRMDVGKTGVSFASVQLIADGVQVISGKGTVTSVSNEEVKLQIKSATEKSRYPQEFYEKYVNRQYSASIDFFFTSNFVVQTVNGSAAEDEQDCNRWLNLDSFLIDGSTGGSYDYWKKQGYIGVPGRALFLPMYDSQEDMYVNAPGIQTDYYDGTPFLWTPVTLIEAHEALFNPSPCPHLIYTVKLLCRLSLGYEFTLEGLSTQLAELVDRLYIVDNCIPKGLDWTAMMPFVHMPKWTFATLLDQLRYLLNLSYSIDTTAKTITARPSNMLSQTAAAAVRLEADDEFSTDYDEDGVEYISATNIAYDIENDNDTRYFAVLTEDMRKSFPVVECASVEEARTKGEAMSASERRQTLFHVPTNYLFYHTDLDEGGDPVNEQLWQCARFTGIVRDAESDTQTSLKFVPAGWSTGQWVNYWQGRVFHKGTSPAVAGTEFRLGRSHSYAAKPLLTLTAESPEKDAAATVQDVAEGEADAPSSESESSDNIYLAIFEPSTVEQPAAGFAEDEVSANAWVTTGPDPVVCVGFPFTDGDLAQDQSPYVAEANKSAHEWSLALTSCPCTNYIGRLHEAQSGQMGSEAASLVDTHTKLCIKAVTTGLPSATVPYLVRGKLYIAEKIEVEIKEGRVQPQKTFYLYEIRNEE